MLKTSKKPVQAAWFCRLLLLATLSVGVVKVVTAQQTASQENQSEAEQKANTQNENTGMTRDQLLSLIANEIVLAPGIGLRNVRLGESMTAVKDRLGTATSVTTSGLTGKITNLVYRLGSETSIVLSGQEVLERISVKGNSSALVRTSEGARFGMQSRLIRRIYNEPSKSRKSRLEYRQLGATFYLESDRVNRIDLYPRRG
ncbi:MAG: hypothetical protein KTR18_00435 [Acidiferrobacterales bacterium]|nr:hypothetical protein [Acidiferrobacterales bacterium]